MIYDGKYGHTFLVSSRGTQARRSERPYGMRSGRNIKRFMMNGVVWKKSSTVRILLRFEMV